MKHKYKPDPAIEDIVLRYSNRGMTILQKHLRKDYCRRTAKKLLSLKRGTVLLTTGFYVQGAAETDGPPGTMCLVCALKKLGFSPVIVTDDICRGLFEPEQIDVVYVNVGDDASVYEKLLHMYAPVALISVERCGHNRNNDYTNMNGRSIADQTARIDTMFELAEKERIFTIGIGDGGNEIGMGNLKKQIASDLVMDPCTVTVDELIVATTSNWGAYALVASLELFSHKRLLLPYQKISHYLGRIVSLGCIDGVTRRMEQSVDGFPPSVEEEIIFALSSTVESRKANGAKKAG